MSGAIDTLDQDGGKQVAKAVFESTSWQMIAWCLDCLPSEYLAVDCVRGSTVLSNHKLIKKIMSKARPSQGCISIMLEALLNEGKNLNLIKFLYQKIDRSLCTINWAHHVIRKPCEYSFARKIILDANPSLDRSDATSFLIRAVYKRDFEVLEKVFKSRVCFNAEPVYPIVVQTNSAMLIRLFYENGYTKIVECFNLLTKKQLLSKAQLVVDLMAQVDFMKCLYSIISANRHDWTKHIMACGKLISTDGKEMYLAPAILFKGPIGLVRYMLQSTSFDFEAPAYPNGPKITEFCLANLKDQRLKIFNKFFGRMSQSRSMDVA